MIREFAKDNIIFNARYKKQKNKQTKNPQMNKSKTEVKRKKR